MGYEECFYFVFNDVISCVMQLVVSILVALIRFELVPYFTSGIIMKDIRIHHRHLRAEEILKLNLQRGSKMYHAALSVICVNQNDP